jgi:DNA-binding protein H-NS
VTTTAVKRQLIHVGSSPVFQPVRISGLSRKCGKASRVRIMKRYDLNSMSVDELWALRVEISSVLESRITSEKSKLEKRLRQLQSNGLSGGNSERKRRPYPRVLPKYRNPDKPTETWAGRGKQPRWVTAQLKSGKKLDDFRIQPASGNARRSGGGSKVRSWAQGRS